jgi:hypothetical protein
MRCESAVSDLRASVRVATIVAVALLVVGLSAAPASGQNGEVVAGDDIKYRSVTPDGILLPCRAATRQF